MTDTGSDRRLAVLQRLFEAFNRHDPDGVMACLSEEVVFDAAGGPDLFGSRYKGKEAVRAAFVATWTNLPDVAWHVGRHTIAGDRAFTEWVFDGHQPDGRRIHAEGVDLFVFEGALIVSKRAFRKDRPLQPGKTQGRPWVRAATTADASA